MRRASDRPPIDPELEPARGILQAGESQPFRLTRLVPSSDLAAVLEHFWLVEWELAGRPTRQVETLPHPTQNVVIDALGRTGIFGLQRAKFTRELSGAGRALGMKFRPGAFRGFFGRPVSEATDKVLPIEEVFGVPDAALEAEFVSPDDPAGMAGATGSHASEPQSGSRPEGSRSRIDRLADRSHSSAVRGRRPRRYERRTRALQRLFDGYVGAGPKWVVGRYRMIEPLEALNAGVKTSLTELAYELGYFDQAHFTKTFHSLTGYPPSDYQKT